MVMNKHKFIYFLNAVLYCLGRWELKGDRIIRGLVYFLTIGIPKLFVTKRVRGKLDRRWRKNREENHDYFYNEIHGVIITFAKNHLMALWTCYTIIFLCVSVGISFVVFHGINMPIYVLVVILSVFLLDEPIYKLILKDYKYIDFSECLSRRMNIGTRNGIAKRYFFV